MPAHIDRRHRAHHRPADYFVDPHGFGRRPGLASVMPPGGAPCSKRVAELTHRLLLDWQAMERPPSGAALGERFGFSRKTFSKVRLGQRWPGELVLAALVATVHPRSATPASPPRPPMPSSPPRAG